MRKRQNQLTLLVIVVVTGFSLAVTWPGNPDKYLPDFIPWPSGHGLNIGGFDRDEFRLGLDLAGGVSVTLEVSGETVQVRQGETLEEFARRNDVDIATLLELNPELEDVEPDTFGRPLAGTFDSFVLPLDVSDELLGEAIEEARLIIEERVNGFGISEAEVTVVGSNRLNAQIPGVTADQAAGLVGSTAELEFREIDPLQPTVLPPVDPFAVRQTLEDAFDPVFQRPEVPGQPRLSDYPVSALEDDVIVVGVTRWIPARGRGANNELVQLTGRFLRADSITRTLDTTGRPALGFELDSEGAELLEQITKRLVTNQDRLGIFLDRQLISAPAVNAVINDRGIITGISDDDATILVAQLPSGTLVAPVTVVSVTVGNTGP